MQKLKRDAQGKVGQGVFIAVWIVSLIIVQWISGFAASALFSRLQENLVENINPLILINTLGTLLIACTQVQVVERLLKQSMRGWMLYTLTGVATTWALYVFFQAPFMINSPILTFLSETLGVYASTILTVLISVAPTPLFQALWLRRHVRDAREAWLWPLAIIILGLVSQGVQMYVISNRFDSINTILPLSSLIMQLIYGVITGGVMHALISHPRETQKAKIEASQDDMFQSEARLTRLQDEETAVYRRPDEQSTQQHAQ